MATKLMSTSFDGVTLIGTPPQIPNLYWLSDGAWVANSAFPGTFPDIWIETGANVAPRTPPACLGARVDTSISSTVQWVVNMPTSRIPVNRVIYISTWVYLPANFRLNTTGGAAATQLINFSYDTASWNPSIQLAVYQENPAVYPDRFVLQVIHTALSSGWNVLKSVDNFPLPRGRWFNIAILSYLNAGAGSVKVWVDGSLFYDSTGTPLETYPMTETFTRLPISLLTYSSYGEVSGALHTLFVDDVEIWDGMPSGPTPVTVTASATASGMVATVTGSITGGTAPYTYVVNWGGGSTSSGSGATISLSHTYASAGTYTITVTATDSASQQGTASGTVTVSPTVVNGYITVVAYAGTTAINASVTIDGYSGTTPSTFTIPAGTYTLTATYQGTTLPSQQVIVTAGQTTTVTLQFPVSYTLTIVSVTGGATSPVAGTYSYSQGATAQVTATASSGYVFSNWLADGANAGSANPLSITMTANHTVQPVFSLRTWALTIISATGGTTNPFAGTYTRNDGTVQSITATASTGYAFAYWLVDGIEAGSTSTISVTMTSNHTVEPVFSVLTRTLTIVAGAGGDTSPLAGTYPYSYGTVVQVTATASAGYKLSYWLLNGSNVGSANPINVTMTVDATIQPVFVQDTIIITVVAGANGTVSPSGTQTLVIGASYQFVALPNTNYVFDHWDLSGANIGSTNPLGLTAVSNMNGKTITAVFAPYVVPPITMTVAVSPAEAGATTPAVGQVQLTPGTVTQFTATRVVGWDFVQWQLDSTAYSNNPLNLPIVQSMNGQTITVVFTRGKVTITASATVGGTVNPTGLQILTIGQSYSYSATATSGAVFGHWELGGVTVSTANPYQLTAALDMDGKTLLAVFASAKISLFVMAGPNGAVSPFGQQLLTVGTKYSFGAFPNNGYKLDRWDLAGANIGSTNPIQLTATMSMDGQTLTGFFLAEETPPAQITINIAVSPASSGSTSPSIGSNTFNIGDFVQFTVTPTGDYAFMQWTLDGMNFNTNPLNLTIAQNMQGKTLIAQLAIPQVTVTVAADANGTVSPSGTQTLIVGHPYQFAAVGAIGYTLDHWELGGQDLGAANPITLTPTSANEGQSLVAFFKEGVVVKAGFSWWVLAIAIPTAVGFTYLVANPSKPQRRR